MATDSSKSQLSLEVVRPGTYAALRKHLQGVTSKHGKGYYHLVHLDMHGALRSVSASRYCRLFENWACFHEFQQPARCHPIFFPQCPFEKWRLSSQITVYESSCRMHADQQTHLRMALMRIWLKCFQKKVYPTPSEQCRATRGDEWSCNFVQHPILPQFYGERLVVLSCRA